MKKVEKNRNCIEKINFFYSTVFSVLQLKIRFATSKEVYIEGIPSTKIPIAKA